MGLKIQILGNAPTESPDVLLVAGNGAEGVIYCHHFDSESNDTITKNFVMKYDSTFNRKVEGYSALAYDGLKIIAKVLIKCGSDKECIKDELYKIKNFRGVTGLTTFDEYGDVIKPIYIKTVKDGKFITLWRSK